MGEEEAQRQVAAWAAGLPPMTAVPTGAPTADGMVCILALLPTPEATEEEIGRFVQRFHFVSREETARAADSQVRWSVESGGAVTVSFLAEDGVSQLELPPDPGVQQWAAMARTLGGTLWVIVLPGMTGTGISAIGHRLSQRDAKYWHLSAGYVPA